MALRCQTKVDSVKRGQRRLWLKRLGLFRAQGPHSGLAAPSSALSKNLWQPYFDDDLEGAVHVRKASSARKIPGCWRMCCKQGCRGAGLVERLLDKKQLQSGCPAIMILVELTKRRLAVTEEGSCTTVLMLMQFLGWERKTLEKRAAATAPVRSVDLKEWAAKRIRVHEDAEPSYMPDGSRIHNVPVDTDTDEEPNLGRELSQKARSALLGDATRPRQPPPPKSATMPLWMCEQCRHGEVPNPPCVRTSWIDGGAGYYRDVAKRRRLRGPALEAHLRSLHLI